MSNSNGRLFSGITIERIVDLMERDLFFARLEYPGGFYQLQEDLASGEYAAGIEFLNSQPEHSFNLTGESYYSAMNALASKCSEILHHRYYFNLNKNLSPFVSYIDDYIDGVKLAPVATIGVGNLNLNAPVSDMYFMITALAMCHAVRHFELLQSGYASAGHGDVMNKRLAIAHLALQGNERYGRRNYNTYPTELDAEWHAIFKLWDLFESYGVKHGIDDDLVMQRLVQAECLKSDKFYYFIPEPVHRSGAVGFWEIISMFREDFRKSFQYVRQYDPVEDANDLVLRVFDSPKWVEFSKKLFAENVGHKRDEMMACIVNWILFGD